MEGGAGWGWGEDGVKIKHCTRSKPILTNQTQCQIMCGDTAQTRPKYLAHKSQRSVTKTTRSQQNRTHPRPVAGPPREARRGPAHSPRFRFRQTLAVLVRHAHVEGGRDARDARDQASLLPGAARGAAQGPVARLPSGGENGDRERNSDNKEYFFKECLSAPLLR